MQYSEDHQFICLFIIIIIIMECYLYWVDSICRECVSVSVVRNDGPTLASNNKN